MPRSQSIDLSHYVIDCGQIGRLKGLQQIPVLPGDVLSLDYAGVIRLSPLRRNLAIDARVDFFVFFVPHRHVYGQDWIDFMLAGVDETVSLDTVNVGGSNRLHSRGTRASGVVPLWIVSGYNRVWNWFFRVPTVPADEVDDDHIGSSDDDRRYGYRIGPLDTVWTTPPVPTRNAADRRFQLDSNQVDLVRMSQQQARWRTEIERDIFARRYQDLMRRMFGTSVNIDVNERPMLCWRQSMWMSGYDVDGTDQASLGNYSGKAAVVGGFRMPPKRFNEHGNVIVLAAVRFPTLHGGEVHRLEKISNPSYKQFAGDVRVDSREPPASLTPAHIIDGSTSNTSLGEVPHGYWWNYLPSRIHDAYNDLDGFPFWHATKAVTLDNRKYVDPYIFDDMFATRQLEHWNMQLRGNVMVRRRVPPALASWFAGAK